jgi:tRNA A-37 threonylcarbamoyl transferase component Bud32
VNPYLNRLMIRDPAQFYGRQRELAFILNRIGAERPQSVSLVGERRMGKSSTLFHLTARHVQERFLPGKKPLGIVFLDFQQLRNITLDEFFALLCPSIQAVYRELSDSGPPGYTAFQRQLDELKKQGRALVLLLDEFDAVTSNPAFSREFYSFLRSAANHYAVAYVTSSKIELQRLCHSAEIADSPFFNIFSNLHLRPFSAEEALELIQVPSDQQGTSLASYADHIVEIAGYFPFYLQIACCAYFDCLTESRGRTPARDEVESRFLEEASPHYDYLLEHMSEDGFRVLTQLARDIQPGPESIYIATNLVKDGYVIQESGTYRIASGLFANHLKSALSSSDFRRSGGQRTSAYPVAVEPGTRIQQYQVVCKVGEGGMGAVYRGKDTLLERAVALKIIRQDLMNADVSKRRFLQEARVSAALSHPTITSVYELLEFEGQVAIIMEWLEGQTLKEKLAKEGAIAWKNLTPWMVQACEGLDAAYRQGVIHRDIKSANLFITSQNDLKILDFGLAKLVTTSRPDLLPSELTSQGAVLGTVDYMSPEQACGQPVDHRSDLFSLGIVMFEALTGRLPFHRNSLAATLHAIVNEPAPDLDLFRMKVDGRLGKVLYRLLEKQPGRRYQTAAQLRHDLQELAGRQPRLFRWWR